MINLKSDKRIQKIDSRVEEHSTQHNHISPPQAVSSVNTLQPFSNPFILKEALKLMRKDLDQVTASAACVIKLAILCWRIAIS